MAEKSAYELWLSRNIKHAKLVLTKGIDASCNAFVNDKLEVLVGLRPRFDVRREEAAGRADSRRPVHRRAAGNRHAQGARASGAAYLRTFVEDAKASGFVGEAITCNGSQGVSVAPPRSSGRRRRAVTTP